MKILAIDVGEKRVGLAMSDELGITCHPHGFFDRAEAITKIAKLISEEEIDNVIIGLPLLADGRPGSQTEDVKKFADALEEKIDASINFENEHLTSIAAEERLKSLDGGLKEKGSIDAMAACIILESYISENTH